MNNRLLKNLIARGLSLLAIAGSVGAAPQPVQPTRHTVVLKPSEGGFLFHLPDGKTPQSLGYWIPTAVDIKHLETDLPKLTQVGARVDVTHYYRQYFGITQGGRRVIYIDGFSASVASEFTGGQSDWHHQLVFVNDGGNAFFHAIYDPKSHRFLEFSFNGVA